jgi:hypothetical protein
LIYIYLNGIMSGIAAYGSGSFEAKAQEIIFDS